MPQFERICPECGASNSFDKTKCVKCRAPLTRPASAEPPPPALFTRGMIARLAWRATKFFARQGFNLALSGTKRGIDRVQNRNKEDVTHEMIEGDFQVQADQTAPPEQTRGVTSDWRVWSAPPNAEPDKVTRLSWGKKK
jgi:ribosomal protein L40E